MGEVTARVDPGFWRGRRVMLTGHTGFKGAWLSAWLLELGAEVHGFSNDVPTQPSLFELARLAEEVRDVRGDVRDTQAVLDAVQACAPDIVLHLAARSLVRPSFAEPVATYATNVMGTVNVLEAVRSTPGVSAALVVTSDKCYENREWVWGYRENEPMGGYDPYSSSKGCAELVTSAYLASYFQHSGTNIASARAGNVIGGGDWAADRLVPDVVRALMAGEEVVLRSPHAVRPWQHVLDCLSGYLVLVQRLVSDAAVQGGWNFGPEARDERTVEQLVSQLSQKWDGRVRNRVDEGPQPHEAHTLTLDSSKARKELGWRPRWGVADAVDRVFEWYSVYQGEGDMGEITREQIRQHMSAVGAEQ